MATLRSAGGETRRISAAWVAGCDGAKSAVRGLCGIGFPGAPYEHVFFVADTEATGTMVPDEVNVYLWRDGFHLFFPMRGKDHWRIVGILPKALRKRPDVSFEDVLPSLHGEAGTGLTFHACTWFSTYRIHHRSASRFRDRRCFLVVSEGRLASLFRTRFLARIAAFAMGREGIQRFAFRNISQTAVQYRTGPLSRSLEGLPREAPRAGDRFPWLRVKLQSIGATEDLYQKLEDLRFHLLAFGEAAPPGEALEVGDLLRMHVIPAGPANDAELARARIPRPSFYLLRPDGYVGLCGPRLDARAVISYVRERLGIRAAGVVPEKSIPQRRLEP
jgi:hypothetical protein